MGDGDDDGDEMVMMMVIDHVAWWCRVEPGSLGLNPLALVA